MKTTRSVIFAKNSLISKMVNYLLEAFFSYCNAVFSIMNKAFIEKDEKRNIVLRYN